MVVVAMTSNPRITPYSFVISNAELSAGLLNRPGTVRVDKIYTLSRKISVKTFGRVNDVVLERIRSTLATLVGK